MRNVRRIPPTPFNSTLRVYNLSIFPLGLREKGLVKIDKQFNFQLSPSCESSQEIICILSPFCGGERRHGVKRKELMFLHNDTFLWLLVLSSIKWVENGWSNLPVFLHKKNFNTFHLDMMVVNKIWGPSLVKSMLKTSIEHICAYFFQLHAMLPSYICLFDSSLSLW